MNSRPFNTVLIIILLPLFATRLYAWGLEDPVAEIVDWYKIVRFGATVEFDAKGSGYTGSYDPDNGYPYGGGHGIVDYDWNWYYAPGAENIWEGEGEDEGYASCEFPEPGKFRVDVTVTDDEGATDGDYSRIYVINVSLSGGGYVLLSDDPDDLVPITFYLEPDNLYSGRLVLRALYSSGGKISVWRDQNMQTEVTLPTWWWILGRGYPTKSSPTTWWVEGIEPSGSLNDVVLEWAYEYGGTVVDSKTINFTVLNVEITTPNGDPTTTEGANETNERAFNDSSSGVLTVECEATPNPDITEIRNYLNNNKIRWTVQAIGDSQLSWNSSWPGDNSKGEGLSCTATFTGLPSSNSDFGLKQVKMELLLDGIDVDLTDTTNIEVFYHKTATNNPGPLAFESEERAPNWFYYWKDGGAVPALDAHGFVYDPEQDYGLFNPNYPAGQGRLRVGPMAGGSDQQTKTFKNWYYQVRMNTGEDGFAGTPNPDPDDKKILPYYDYDHGNWVDGEPYAVAILSGNNGVIDTVAHGNDEIEYRDGEGWVLHTGWDGKLDWRTVVDGDDQWKMYTYMGREKHIDPGWGQPWSICVECGDDDWLTSRPHPQSDDEIDLTGAQTEQYNIDYSGIDLCALVCTHELQHQTNYEEPGDDSDGDNVKDHLENGVYHLCPEKTDTYDMDGEFPGRGYYNIGDDEFLCRMSEMTTGPSSRDPSKDWSEGGEQWQ